MSRLSQKASSEFVRLPGYQFAVWWGFIFGVHVVTGAYNALYAYCYRKLRYSFLNLFLDSFKIGMPPSYHHTIVVVHAILSAIHALCALLMIIGSLRHRSLSFTPWSPLNTGDGNTKDKIEQPSTRIGARALSKVYAMIVDRRGLLGVNGAHFHLVIVGREIVETALQTLQAYRMSKLLPRILLNRFYVGLLAVNCWSSVIVNSRLFPGDEARKRFACIVLDCILDLMACMGVELIIVWSYASDYNGHIEGFSPLKWYDDEWVARALNEFKMVLVVSWSDLASRAIFSFGLVLATTNMKELLERLPTSRGRVAQSDTTSNRKTSFWTNKIVRCTARPRYWTSTVLPGSKLARRSDSCRDAKILSPQERIFVGVSHVFFAVWGFVVLGFHIHTSAQPTLPQCLMQVRPWGALRPSCYLVGLDCHTLGISGTLREVDQEWNAFDSSTVVQLLIRHCPALQVPDIFSDFHALRGIKVYNTTISEWGASAALTNANHPAMASLFIARVNMTDGLLPPGLQSADFPPGVYDIEICVTNLIALPNDLDTKWPHNGIVQVEYGQLTTVTLALVRLQPIYLAVTGNPISTVPPEIFSIDGLLYLGISDMNIYELPRNVTQVASTLIATYIGNTFISFFWSWVDERVESLVEGQAPMWVAGGCTYCVDLAKIRNGSADNFSVPLLPEYSQTLMNSSNIDSPLVSNAVYCGDGAVGLFYPIDTEDSINAISPPPPLVRPS